MAVTVLSIAVGVLGIVAGVVLYRGRREGPETALGRFLSRQWYIEAIYNTVVVGSAKRLAVLLAEAVEVEVIDGAVNGIARVVGRTGTALRRLQTGYVRNYAAVMLVGTVLVLGYWLIRP